MFSTFCDNAGELKMVLFFVYMMVAQFGQVVCSEKAIDPVGNTNLHIFGWVEPELFTDPEVSSTLIDVKFPNLTWI